MPSTRELHINTTIVRQWLSFHRQQCLPNITPRWITIDRYAGGQPRHTANPFPPLGDRSRSFRPAATSPKMPPWNYHGAPPRPSAENDPPPAVLEQLCRRLGISRLNRGVINLAPRPHPHPSPIRHPCATSVQICQSPLRPMIKFTDFFFSFKMSGRICLNIGILFVQLLLDDSNDYDLKNLR
jgi:hypothetical protein